MKWAFEQSRGKAELLFESERAFIQRERDVVELVQYGPWSAQLAKLARKHKINALHIRETYQQEWPSLDFLLDLPPLERLHVVLSRPTDLSPIAKLSSLQHLGLMGEVGDERSSSSFDFSPLKKLKRAYVEIAPATISLLSCSSLRALWIWNHTKPWLGVLDFSRLAKLEELHVTAWAKLATLDLSHQPALEQLHLEAIGKLKSLTLHPKAKVRKLKLGGCGPFRIDWDRMGEDLHELELSGPLRFPLQDVLKAPQLRRLDTTSVRTFPPLQFLLKLKHLERFDYFTTPPGPKWSDTDESIIQQINARAPRSR